MDISNIYDAKEVLKDVISKTPLVHADKLHENLWIKAENLQCRKPCTESRLFLHEDGNQGNDRYAENRSAV